MKNLLLVLLLLLCSPYVVAQEFEGRVLDLYSGSPVSGATISLRSGDQWETGEQGEFYLKDLRLPARLRITAPGYDPLLVKAIPSEEPQVFYLTPQAEALSEVILRSSLVPKELLRTPASVSVVGAEDLQRSDATSIVTALNTVSGVYVHQGALNTTKISIRGVGARSQYATDRIKAYFMEIPLSTAEGETTLDDIDPSVIGRAEIIKGPASGIYGAGLGGVIRLFAPEDPPFGTHVGLKSTVGSFGLLKNTVKLGHADEASHVSAVYNELRTDGFRENGAYRRSSLNLLGKLANNENHSLSFLGQFTRLKAYIPSSLDREDFEQQPAAAAFSWKAARGYESYDKGLLGLSYQQQFSPHFSNTTAIHLNFRDGYEPRPFDILEEQQVAIGARSLFRLDQEIFSLPLAVSFGGEYYQEWYEVATFENLHEEVPGEGSVLGEILSNNAQDRNYLNFFAQGSFFLSNKLEVETGLNLNTTYYDLTDRYTEDAVDQSGRYRFETVLSPRLGLLYSLEEGKNLYLSVSHGFSTPGVAETLTPEGRINTDLQPETGMNYEIGFKGNFLEKRLYMEMAAYTVQVADLLIAERVAEDRYIGRNIGRTDHNGLEILINYLFLQEDFITARSFVNAAVNDFRFDHFVDEGVDYAGNRIPAVPDKSIQAGLDLETAIDLSLLASFQHEGRMPLNDANSGYTADYQLVHLKLSWSPKILSSWDTTFFAGTNNVFDTHYAASIVPNSVGFGGASPRYFYPGKPRNHYGGLSISYRF